MDWREFIEKAKATKSEWLPWVAGGVPAALYLFGVLCTGLDDSYEGFSVWPGDAMRALFSVKGRSLLFLIILAGVGVWCMLKLRNVRYAGMIKDDRNFWYSDKGTYGTAEFMNRTRMKRCLDCQPGSKANEAEGDIIGIRDGLVLSRPADSMHNKNCAAYGSSGSMKSRAIIRNKIIGSQRRGESMILTDPKGELFRDTAVWLRKSGYTVRVLNMVSLDKSNGWNFMMDALKEANGQELEIVEQMANVIIANTGGKTNSKDDFWDKAERGLLKAIMLYQYYIWEANQGPLAFSWAYQFLLSHDVPKLTEAFSKLTRTNKLNAAATQFNIFLKAGANVCPNIHFGLLSRLNIFNNPGICDVTGRNEIDLERPANEKCAYFVIVSDQDSTYDFIACLFFTLFFIRVVKFADTKTISGKCPIPVNLLLDEFPNIGEIPDFAKKMATVRSRDVNITILFQSIPQLKERYQHDSHYGILGNCDFSVFMGTTDPVTAKFVSERTGETSILVETQMEEHNKFDPIHFTAQHRESQGVGKRLLMTQDEVMTMGKDEPLTEIIIMRDQPVLVCEKFDFTRDPATDNWEPFMMTDYNPNDPFWFEDNEATTGPTPATPKAQTVTKSSVPSTPTAPQTSNRTHSGLPIPPNLPIDQDDGDGGGSNAPLLPSQPDTEVTEVPDYGREIEHARSESPDEGPPDAAAGEYDTEFHDPSGQEFEEMATQYLSNYDSATSGYKPDATRRRNGSRNYKENGASL